jgi:short-subunit dehydrogenase
VHFRGVLAVPVHRGHCVVTQSTGSIVNISSIGARITPAGSGYYSATKAALEGISGSLRREVEPLGINVTVVEPGAFRTDFAGRSLTQSA